MAGYITTKLITMTSMVFVLWLTLAYGYPHPMSDDNMVHNNNYDMIMPDDYTPAESMQFQNFDGFFNAELQGDLMSEMEMQESRISPSKVQPPQPLSEKEKHLREHLEDFDVIREKRNQKLLTKGSSQARKQNHDWEQFDYDAHISNH